MATSLTLSTAGLTAQLSTDSDASAQEVMLRFAHATGANPAWTPQQKLNHAAAQLADYMMRIARERYIQEESATIQADAIINVHW
jgi:cytochrome P450